MRDQGDEMVAVGRYDVLLDKSDDDKRVAEVAFLVQDDFQGRGDRLTPAPAPHGLCHGFRASPSSRPSCSTKTGR